MPHDRFFIDTPFSISQEVVLEDPEEMHHLKVMRVQEEENLELINGKNQIALSKLVSFEKKRVRFLVLEVFKKEPPAFPIILCQAIPRLNRLDTIVEKGTELGMTELWLFPGALSEKKDLSENQKKRLTFLAVSALKQCGRLDLPKIVFMPPLLEWKPLPFPAYFGDTNPKASSFTPTLGDEKGIIFFVGPEGGFTEKEEDFLSLKLQSKGVKLHTNILRTDTASLVALSLIHSFLIKP